jgi:hypothetical protein
VGRFDGKRPLGRPRRRWEQDIKTDLQEVGWGGMGSKLVWLGIWTDGALVIAVINFRVP